MEIPKQALNTSPELFESLHCDIPLTTCVVFSERFLLFNHNPPQQCLRFRLFHQRIDLVTLRLHNLQRRFRKHKDLKPVSLWTGDPLLERLRTTVSFLPNAFVPNKTLPGRSTEDEENVQDKAKRLLRWVILVTAWNECIDQRSPNFLDAGPKLRSYQRPRAGLFCALKKNKTKRHTHNIRHVCTLQFVFVVW